MAESTPRALEESSYEGKQWGCFFFQPNVSLSLGVTLDSDILLEREELKFMPKQKIKYRPLLIKGKTQERGTARLLWISMPLRFLSQQTGGEGELRAENKSPQSQAGGSSVIT